jgi:GT2 family glycosyltransferase
MARLSACQPPPGEVIVVIDGASDGAAGCAAAAGARVMTLPTPAGPAAARNAGAEAARGSVLLFVDADVAVPVDLMGRVAGILAADPQLAAVIGSYDDEPAERGFLSQYRNLLHHYVHQTSREDATTFWCGCGAVRREVFLALGGLDAGFGAPSVEDIEFGYRLTRAGRRIRLCKELQVTHLKRWAAGSMVRTDIFDRAVPWTRLVIRSRKLPNDLNLRTSARVSTALVFALVASLAAAAWTPWALAAAACSVLGLTAINAEFYAFLWRKRGPLFALAAMPWHWLYFACAGIGLVIGLAREIVGGHPTEGSDSSRSGVASRRV